MNLSSLDVFHFLVACHIVTGASGALIFWVPVASRKGGRLHRKWGRVFAMLMLATGMFAALMATTTLIDPMNTHPRLVGVPGFEDPQTVRGIFGWMMLYLAVLTVNLAWHGWLCVTPGRDTMLIRGWHDVALQVLLVAAALNCALRGIEIGQLLMVGISFVGFATVATNVWFMAKARPTRAQWLCEHIKSSVGAGISVYTAFFAFGAIRLIPELALNPAFWSVPLITGVSMIIWFQRVVTRGARAVPGQ
jgi:hypothetical protein